MCHTTVQPTAPTAAAAAAAFDNNIPLITMITKNVSTHVCLRTLTNESHTNMRAHHRGHEHTGDGGEWENTFITRAISVVDLKGFPVPSPY